MKLRSLFTGERKTDASQVSQSNTNRQHATFRNRIENMLNAGFKPQCIIDCGASVGYWSYEVSKVFPGTQIVAIEPNSIIIPQTRELLKSVSPEVIIEQCALGSHPGSAYLNIWDNEHTKMSGSSLKEHVQGDPKARMEVRLETLDNLCETHKLVPDLIKLDLQGGELDALKGGKRVLEDTEVIISEFGCLEAYVDRTTPYELMEFMYSNQFCLYDIIDLIYRPFDNALTGGDFIFVKNSSALKQHKGYK